MKKVLWFVAVVIVLSFGILGQAYLLGDRPQNNLAGKIFGKKISLEDFDHYYRQTVMQAMIQYGQNFNKIREFLNLEAETWDRMILMHEAKKRKIQIPDQSVVDAIKEYKFFQREGQFDKLLYDDILRFVFKVGPHDFEEGIRNSLKFAEIYKQETAGITASEEEVHEAYRQKNEKIQLSYILASADQFKDQIQMDEAQAQNYYQEHKADFALPPMVSVEYVRLDFPENADDKEKDTVKAKAVTIAREARAQGNLEAAAQKYDAQTNTSGFFSMEQPNLQIGSSYPALQRIFQLKTGETTEAIETPTGYQIVKMKEKKEGYVPEYAEAKDKVIDAWKLSEAKKLAKNKAEENLTAIKKAFADVRRPDFAATAKNLGLDIQQTPIFNRTEYLPNLGISKEFQDVAFSLNEEAPLADQVVETLKGSAVIYLDSKQPLDEEDFRKQKEEIADNLVMEKRNAAFSQFLTQLRLKANLQDNISELMARQKKS